MPYKKGDVFKNESLRIKILEVLGELYFCSEIWDTKEAASYQSKISGTFFSEAALSAHGWSLCPPDQTLLPAEKWVPKEGERWFFGYVTSDGKASANSSQMGCEAEARIGNVHKTSEEAIEWAKKRYNIA